MGFDFAGHYTRIETPDLIEAEFGERTMQITFTAENGGVRVRETFDPETDHSVEAQKAGWQAILDNFKKYVELTI